MKIGFPELPYRNCLYIIEYYLHLNNQISCEFIKTDTLLVTIYKFTDAILWYSLAHYLCIVYTFFVLNNLYSVKKKKNYKCKQIKY